MRYYDNILPMQYKIESGLDNPRIAFNFGYHSGHDDASKGRNLQSAFIDSQPYYKLAYKIAIDEFGNGITYTGNSDSAWYKFLSSLSNDDYATTLSRVRESLITEWEVLYVNVGGVKRSRKDMTQETKKEIAKRIIEIMQQS